MKNHLLWYVQANTPHTEYKFLQTMQLFSRSSFFMVWCQLKLFSCFTCTTRHIQFTILNCVVSNIQSLFHKFFIYAFTLSGLKYRLCALSVIYHNNNAWWQTHIACCSSLITMHAFFLPLFILWIELTENIQSIHTKQFALRYIRLRLLLRLF